LSSSNFDTRYSISVLSPLIAFLNLWRSLYTYFIFVMNSCLFPFKFFKIIFGCTKLFVKSCIIFMSSSINLPAKRCPSKYCNISWLWIPLRIANFQAFYSLLTFLRTLNNHPNFLDLVDSCFNFFFGTLWFPLLSQTNSNIGLLIALDLFMKIVNLDLFSCRCIQPSN